MDEITKARRAELASGLKQDEAFKLFMGELRDLQASRFFNPSASPEELQEAHGIVRALKLLETHIDRQITEMRLLEKREERKHRAND